MKTTKRISVLLADDHMIVLEGLKMLLGSETGLEVAGEAVTGREAVKLAGKLRPDVVVMDVAMTQLNGLEAARQIRKAFPDTKVIFLSAYGDAVYVEQAMEAGASGYLLKQTASSLLAEAIRAVHKGETCFSPDLPKRLTELTPGASGERIPAGAQAARLTSREVEVLQLIAESAVNKQIADALGVSIKTVEKHRDNLMKKLDIHDAAGLTRYAMSAGVIERHVQVPIV